MPTALALCSLALAADPEFAGTNKEGAKVEEPEARLTAELGAALTTGNSEFYTLTSGVNGSYRWNRSQVALKGGTIVGASKVDQNGDGTIGPADLDGDGVIDIDERDTKMQENARRLFADGRYDLFLSSKDSLYVLVGAYTDRFAGFDLRTHEQIGYSRQLVKNDSTNLIGEIGVDFAQENYVDGVDPNTANVLAARVLVGFTHKFSDSVGIENHLEVYENVINLEDLRLLNTASLVSALSSKLSLKLSHSLIFDNDPVDGFRKADQAMNVTLVASVL